jgi:hypothetical protein
MINRSLNFRQDDKRLVSNGMRKFIWLFIMAIIAPQLALADGGLIPPPNHYVYETDQRAVIYFENNTETLVVSTKFQGDADNFAWIIPTPAKPEVKKSSLELFNSLAKLTEKYADAYDRSTGLGLGLEYAAPAKQAVEVIETKKIDYYDISVLKASDEQELNKWFNDHGYKFPTSANYVLKSYIDNNWYFTAVKISGDYLSDNLNQVVRYGDLIPLSLKFSTDKIVFPMKISSIDYYYDETQAQQSSQMQAIITRYKPIFNFICAKERCGRVFPESITTKQDSQNAWNEMNNFVHQLRQDIFNNASYQISVASASNFISEQKYNQIISEYQKSLEPIRKNNPSYNGSVDSTDTYISQFVPEINNDAMAVYEYGNKISSQTYKRGDAYINLAMYIVSDKVYDYGNFSVQYADTIKPEEIEKLASDDKGDPWLKPEAKKYVLTRLSGNLRQSEMTNDLYLKVSDYKVDGAAGKGSTGFIVLLVISGIITLGLIGATIYFYRKNN